MLLPKNTHAIVVGIGQYDDPLIDSLHAPVEDAIRFTGWLLSQGVPKDNIQLFLSRTQENNEPAPVVEEGSPTIRIEEKPATEAEIKAAIQKLSQVPRDLLWFFWGGHGLISRDRHHRLLYKDAAPGNWLNLDLRSLMNTLRTNLFPAPHLGKQIFIVDACRHFGWQDDGVNTLPTFRFSEGHEEIRGREQFALFAAGPGESAYERKADAGQWSGDLSRTLLERLKTRPAGQWPPDMDAITRELVARFTALRADGHADQTPTYLWNRDWGTNEKSHFADSKAPPILTIRVEPRENFLSGYFIHGWLYRDGHCDTVDPEEGQNKRRVKNMNAWVLETDLERCTINLIQAALDLLDGGPTLHIELILPKRLLLQPIDEWKIPVNDTESEAIGFRWPVMLRSFERIADRKYVPGRGLWKNNWKRLQVNWNSTEYRRWWRPGDDSRSARQEMEEAHTLLFYAARLSADEQCTSCNDILNGILSAGVPIALWQRGYSDDVEQRQQPLIDILNTRTHEEVPCQILAARKTQKTHRFVLFWDSPERIPIKNQTETGRPSRLPVP